MKKPVIIASAIALSAAAWTFAYNIDSFTYEEMVAKSDLVVIAEPVESRGTGERHVDPNVKPAITVTGVVTTCRALYVLKGSKNKEFKLHHFREVDRDKAAKDISEVIMGPQIGIAFDQSKGSKRYLMFLIREAGGRYAPFDGQTDVEGLSIQELWGTSVD